MSRTNFRMNLNSTICLNFKEFMAQSSRHISSLNDSDVTRTHNHSVRKGTLNYLAKLVIFNSKVMFQSVTESNANGQTSAALSQIF